MIDAINKAIDMGWRVIQTDYGTMSLVPPEGTAMASMQRMVGIPAGLEDWVKARELGKPDLNLRNSIKAKVQTWYRLEWQTYLVECENDREYAVDIILLDATCEFDIDDYEAKKWFETR